MAACLRFFPSKESRRLSVVSTERPFVRLSLVLSGEAVRNAVEFVSAVWSNCDAFRSAVLSDDRKLAVELVELERSQFGNELHDGVIPLLFVSASKVTNLRDKLVERRRQDSLQANDGELVPVLDQLSGWLEEAMEVSRRLLTEVYPPDLGHCDLRAAVVETLDRLFPDWSHRVDWELDPAVSQVSQPVACVIYRIVLEAIRNACQHGKAKKVLVSVRKLEHAFEVAIFDNGTGFEVSQVPSGHFGLRVMHCRAELISGKLRIESAVGGPTTVALRVPIAG